MEGSQVVIAVKIRRISQVVVPVNGGITSCGSREQGRRLKKQLIRALADLRGFHTFLGPFVSRLSLSRSQMAPSFPPLAITIYPIMMLPKKQNIFHNLQFETSLATGVNRHGCLELTSVWPGL
jgi:hypothetical protein